MGVKKTLLGIWGVERTILDHRELKNLYWVTGNWKELYWVTENWREIQWVTGE